MVTLNHTSSDFSLAANISGNGTVNALSGITTLSGDNTVYQGNFNIDAPATLIISDQKNIGTNTVSLTGGTLAIDSSQDWKFINILAGEGTLSVDTAGNRFDFTSLLQTDNFRGVLALKDTLFSLASTNTDALKNTLLKLRDGSVATVGDGLQAIDGLAFDGGTLVMGTVTPGHTATDNILHTTGQLDISGSGTVQVNTGGTVSNDTPVPDTSISLLEQDDGNRLIQLVSTDGSVTGNAGNLTLSDQNGNIISNGGTKFDISQGGSTVAEGTYDYRLTSGNSVDGLYINYGLTQVELLGQGSDALTLNNEGRTGSAADLSARLTGRGDLAIDTGTGNTVSLSNLDNDYTGITDIRSGTLLMQNDSVLGATSVLQMAQGTALEMNGHRQTVGSVNIEEEAQVNLDGGHLQITQGGSIGGALIGSGSLALTGGTLAVDGANSTLSADISVVQGATANLSDAQGLGTGKMSLAGLVNLNSARGIFSNSLSEEGVLALNDSQILLAGDSAGFRGTFIIDETSNLTATAAHQLGGSAITNAGLLTLDTADNWVLSNRITGAGSLAKYGSGVVSLGDESSGFTGTTDIHEGGLTFGENGTSATLSSSQVNIHQAGFMAGRGIIDGNVRNQGSLAVGESSLTDSRPGVLADTVSPNQITINGNLVNEGQVRIGSSSADSPPGNQLVINGNYTGNNGYLSFNTALAGDASATDHLAVSGDTTGTTRVSVTNKGGQGAATVEGIELISVNGNSAGEFVQDGRIVAGAYDYTLVRGSGAANSNWYLTSQEPGTPTEPGEPGTPTEPGGPSSSAVKYRPELGSYLANNAAANNLFMTSLHDRLGETQYTDILTGEKKVTSMWMRNAGSHTRFRESSGQLKTQANSYVLQIGGDLAQWSSDGLDRWHIGVMGGYGHSESRTRSDLTGYQSRGRINGYSAGLYGTWYQNEADKTGAWIDSWVLYNWFDNKVTGQDLAAEEYQSRGMTASVEAGYSFKMGERGRNSYWLQPQAQVVWMGVRADDNREQNGTWVKDETSGNLQTRLGLKAYMKGHNSADNEKSREFQPFVEANWIHNTQRAAVKMDDVRDEMQGTRNVAELKVGVEGQITPRMTMWGNVAQQIGDQGYSDTQGMLGIKYTW
ncbi:autotransporter outer membrane beta-barrel domain-containing protein [Enterobacter ludwigii]|uniref:autotransporter outer membrane beta-barrel domain-containing protein n=1 Tax=Enterobacter ludwigii TaxID=299767 RepID=UPI003F5C3925